MFFFELCPKCTYSTVRVYQLRRKIGLLLCYTTKQQNTFLNESTSFLRYRVKSTSLLSGRTCLEKILATTVLILVVFCFLVTMIAINVRKYGGNCTRLIDLFRFPESSFKSNKNWIFKCVSILFFNNIIAL
jgi:hypothetical protein